MKKLLLTLFTLTFACIMQLSAATVSQSGSIVKVTGCTAGNLATALTTNGFTLTTITSLIVEGDIDARDFYAMKSQMTALAIVDLGGASIVEFDNNDELFTQLSQDDFAYDEIPNDAFKNKTVLTNIVLPLSVKTIGSSAFFGCTGLTHVLFTSNLKSIYSSGFKNSGLKSIDIPAGVGINQNAFLGCPIDSVYWNGPQSTINMGISGLLTPSSYNVINKSGVVTVDGEYINSSTTKNAITFKSLVIYAGAEIVIESGKTLNILNDLVLHSDANNGTATFYNKGGILNVGGKTIVEQYLTSGRFWYIASPIPSSTFTAPSGTQEWVWYEKDHGYTNGGSTASGQGFVVYPGSSGITNFTGDAGKTFNFADVTRTITNTPGNEYTGLSIVGNPYPAYLDWKQVYNANPTINATMAYSINGNAATYNALSTYANGGLQYVPPMQAIWVRASAQTELTMKNSYCVSRGGIDETNLKSDVETDSEKSKILRLKVANGNYTDEQVLLFNSQAENNFDLWDSEKMFAEVDLFPQIYTTVDAKKLIINSMKDIDTTNKIAMYFTTKHAGNFTIKASGMNGFDGYKIFLKDKLTNKSVDLSADSAYAFESPITADNDRFEVSLKAFKAETGNTVNKNNKIAIYSKSGAIVIEDSENKIKGVATIYNLTGQIVAQKSITSNKTIFSQNLSAGIYFVSVSDNNTVITKSIEIQ